VNALFQDSVNDPIGRSNELAQVVPRVLRHDAPGQRESIQDVYCGDDLALQRPSRISKNLVR